MHCAQLKAIVSLKRCIVRIKGDKILKLVIKCSALYLVKTKVDESANREQTIQIVRITIPELLESG